MYEKNFKQSVKNVEDCCNAARGTNSIEAHKFLSMEAQAHAQLAIATAIMYFAEQVEELRGAIEEVSDTVSRELNK